MLEFVDQLLAIERVHQRLADPDVAESSRARVQVLGIERGPGVAGLGQEVRLG